METHIVRMLLCPEGNYTLVRSANIRIPQTSLWSVLLRGMQLADTIIITSMIDMSHKHLCQ